MWIRTVRPSIWFHERFSGKLKTASLFFINKSLLGRTHRLLLLWRIRKGEAESTAHQYQRASKTFCALHQPTRDISEKAMAPHSSALAWKIPWTEEPGGLQSTGSLRVGHD